MQYTHILDINIIDTHNSKTIGVIDSSIYDPNVPINNPTIQITAPGGYSTVSHPFTPNSVNTINSNNAGISNVCKNDELMQMPDGIWIFRYSVNPNLTLFTNRTYLRTFIIECKLQKIILSFLTNTKDVIGRDKQKKALLDIQILIDGAISAANDGNATLAMELYNKANDLITKFSTNRCNNC